MVSPWKKIGPGGPSADTVPIPHARVPRPPAGAPPLTRMPRPSHIPLAPAQERMWRAAQQGRAADWNVVRALRIRGARLDAAALRGALADVIARHLPLRTRFPLTERGPAQIVLPSAAELPVIALRPNELPGRLAGFAAEEMDLATGPPLRAALFVLTEQDAVLALSIHHIAFDGRSMFPFTRDLITAYHARVAGQPPVWAPLPVDYLDYTLWKHARLGDYADPASQATQQLRYWSNTLAGRPCPLNFPYDRPRPALPDTRGDTIAVAFDSAVHRGLLTRARQAGASVFMVLQAALALTVGAFARCPDVTVATAVSGRDHRLLRDLVGNFADDVLLRLRLDRVHEVDALLDHARRVTLAAFAHPDTPNHRVKRCLPEDPAHPLFQATLILEQATVRPSSPHPATGLSVTEVPTGVVRAKHDLEFALTQRYRPDGTATGIDGLLIYPIALFDRATTTRFLERFATTVRMLADGYRGTLTPLLAIPESRCRPTQPTVIRQPTTLDAARADLGTAAADPVAPPGVLGHS
ncbi:condensation domain-containing protein [Nocardia blacklockiae]|uniref:condensation domain-containing protein n=1 Tax=Nocardia blacklockiae TaxID=480036 RepID=UPI0018942666|nr:condensation domain-containing protein [Nocardia blacklockiae]MBF6175352.1 non-ribosomal peptide synthetase [Nocardia blacklockiae]